MRKSRFFVAVAAVSLVVATQAWAASVGSLIVSGPNNFSDEDREYLIDRTVTATGQIDTGDSFRGLLNINTINSGGANIGGLTPNDELSGIFQVLISNVIPLGGGQASFTLRPDPAFGAVYGSGAIVALFASGVHNSASDFDDAAPATPPAGTDDGAGPRSVPPSSADVGTGLVVTEEAFIATAIDGTPFLTLGFTGAPILGITQPNAAAGEGGSGVAIANVLQAFTFASGVSGGTFNFGLSVLTTGPAFPVGFTVTPTTLGFFGPTQFAVSEQVRGVADLDTPFEISSNINGSFNTVVSNVPEPTSLLLFGGGLVGLGVLLRRRNKM